MMPRTIFIAGHARLPQGMAANDIRESFTITVEIDKKYSVIMEASCTLATEHGREFIARLMHGYSLKDGINELIHEIKVHYRGKARNTLIAAIKDLYQQYTLLD